MIPEIDEAILGSLKKGLDGLVPAGSVTMGPGKDEAGVYVNNTMFTIQESGMPVSDVLFEETEQRFDTDGHAGEFPLSGAPVKEILEVEYPKGTLRSAPDDYAFDRLTNTINFRDTPKRGKDAVRIKYSLDKKPQGELRFLKFALTYMIRIRGESYADRDMITLMVIESLYRDVGNLFKHGVDDIKLERGYASSQEELPLFSELEYTVWATRRIKIDYPPIEKIEIKKS